MKTGGVIGRSSVLRIPDASDATLIPVIEDRTGPVSVVHADGELGYLPLKGKQYAMQS
jgi:transposase-like protein